MIGGMDYNSKIEVAEIQFCSSTGMEQLVIVTKGLKLFVIPLEKSRDIDIPPGLDIRLN